MSGKNLLTDGLPCSHADQAGVESAAHDCMEDVLRVGLLRVEVHEQQTRRARAHPCPADALQAAKLADQFVAGLLAERLPLLVRMNGAGRVGLSLSGRPVCVPSSVPGEASQAALSLRHRRSTSDTIVSNMLY